MAGEVLSGPERRRRWGAEEKAQIIAEAGLPGAKVSDIARRHGVSRSLLYTWRRESERGRPINGAASPLPDLVPIMITDGAEVSKRPALPAERAAAATKGIGTIEIALPGSIRVTVRGRIEERLLRAVLSALRSV
jgi:transposase